MTKVKLIRSMLKTMKPLMDTIGKKIKLEKKFSDMDPDQIMAFHDWLENIFLGTFKAAHYVWSKHPQEIWDNYYRYSCTKLPEVRALEKNLRLFKKAVVKNVPKGFKVTSLRLRVGSRANAKDTKAEHATAAETEGEGSSST